jgi:acyl-CoA thioesterase I
LVCGSIAEYRNYWQERAAAPAADNAITYVALGDSAAQGIGASQPQKGYVGLIESDIEYATGRPVHVINLSVSGARLIDVLEKQLPQLADQDINPRTIVTLDVGSNDMKNYDPAQFARQFEEILRQLPQQTVVADVPYFGPDFHRHGGKQARQANQVIEPLLEKYGLRHAPVYRYTRERNSLFYYATDLFHPSDRGYRSWFMAFWPEVRAQLERPE